MPKIDVESRGVVMVGLIKLRFISLPIFFFLAVSIEFRLQPGFSASASKSPLESGTPCTRQEIHSLEAGKLIEKTLAGGEAHNYRVTVAAGQYLHATIEQRGIDLIVTLFAPSGQKIIEVDSPNGDEGPEPVSLVAEIAGDYRIEVRSSDKQARPGRYEARIDALRVATEADRTRVTAERAVIEAEQLIEGDAAAKRHALQKYDEALALWQRLNDQSGIVAALTARGDIYRALSERPKALEAYLQALPLWQALHDQRREATALTRIGVLSTELGERRKALAYHEQALPLWRAIKDKSGEAASLNNLGEVHAELGEKRKALEYFNQVLPLRRAVKDKTGEATTLNSIGVAYSDLGEAQKALDAYAQALPLRPAGSRGRAITLNNMGRAYDALGASEEALRYYNQSLTIMRAIPDRRGEAQTLNYMGLAYWSLGEYEKALEHFHQSLPLRREVKDRAGEAVTLNNTGLVYDSLGKPREALEVYQQALPLIREVGDRQAEARVLNNLGFVYETLGEKLKARDAHTQALELSRAVGDRLREAQIRYGLARLERAQGRLNQARMQIGKTIEIVESLRAKITGSELRASYRAAAQRYYEFQIDLLMRMHKRQPGAGLASLAFQTSERARARSLLELLTEAGADIRQGVAADLVGREHALQEQLSDKTAEQIKLRSSKQTEERATAAAVELETLAAELRGVQSQIRRDSPRYAALTQPQPSTARAIQQQILDANTLLLEFALGEERSYLWAVTPTTIRSFTLPSRDEIETVARQFYTLLTTRSQLQANLAPSTKQARLSEADAQCAEAAATMSRMLLGPVMAQLGNKRLLIVADGALQYIPFAALPSPRASVMKTPLIVEHEIINLPSASTLAVLRRESSARQPGSKSIAVLADPVFELQDERLKNVRANTSQKSDEAGKKSDAQAIPEASRILVYKSASASGASNGEFRIPRLPYTRREAEAVLSLAPTHESKAAFDFNASRATMMSDELSAYRILHLATHGFLNSAQPELSGLVLSLIDEKGAPQNGFLLAPEIYNLKLSSAELVVLSACQTGLGKEVKGEGLIGLTRGFMYAGTPRVVVSLWSVSDQATAELMQRFYQGLLRDKLSPAASLRAAQVTLWKQKQWQAPYYWAAFTLQGEWR